MIINNKDDKKIERLNTNLRTKRGEFRFAETEDVVPTNTIYHSLILRDKSVKYQTREEQSFGVREIVKQTRDNTVESLLSDYFIATKGAPKVTSYFKDRKVPPKQKDYTKGSYKRYFLRLAGNKNADILEVDKKTYNAADGIYEGYTLDWSLKQNANQQSTENAKSLNNLAKRIPEIKVKLVNLIEYNKT